MEKYLPRIVDKVLQNKLEYMGAVLIEGNDIGGFINNNQGVIENCSIRGNSYGSVYIKGNGIGGFVYKNENGGIIKNSYFVGNIVGGNVCGFVQTNRATIENSYANLIIEGVGDASGFVQENGGTIKNC